MTTTKSLIEILYHNLDSRVTASAIVENKKIKIKTELIQNELEKETLTRQDVLYFLARNYRGNYNAGFVFEPEDLLSDYHLTINDRYVTIK